MLKILHDEIIAHGHKAVITARSIDFGHGTEGMITWFDPKDNPEISALQETIERMQREYAKARMNAVIEFISNAVNNPEIETKNLEVAHYRLEDVFALIPIGHNISVAEARAFYPHLEMSQIPWVKEAMSQVSGAGRLL